MALLHEGEPGRHLAQDVELAAGEALVALLGRGEVREDPLHLDARRRARPLGEGDEGVGRQAVPVEPRLELEVQGDRPAGAPARCGERLHQVRRRHGRTEAQRRDALRVGRRRVTEDEDRRVDAGLPELLPLVHAHDGEPGRARAVAVGVRLHDGPDARGRGARRQEPHVVGEGIEIDLGPGGATAPRGREKGHGAHDNRPRGAPCYPGIE